MTALAGLVLGIAERTLRVDVDACGVTRVTRDHDTGWRTLPGWVAAQLAAGTAVVERAGLPDLVVRAPRCVLIPAGLRHRSRIHGGRGGISRWALFQARVFAGVDVLALHEVPEVLAGAAARRIGDANAALAAAGAPPADLRALIHRQELGFALVRAVLDVAAPRPAAAGVLAGAERLAPVLAHIEAHLARPLSRAGLARLVGLSPTRFHAVFRAAMGAAPREYVLGLRLARAQRLLIAGGRSVQDIAAEVGFADPFHFSRLFRRRVGTSPLGFRRSAARGA